MLVSPEEGEEEQPLIANQVGRQRTSTSQQAAAYGDQHLADESTIHDNKENVDNPSENIDAQVVNAQHDNDSDITHLKLTHGAHSHNTDCKREPVEHSHITESPDSHIDNQLTVANSQVEGNVIESIDTHSPTSDQDIDNIEAIEVTPKYPTQGLGIGPPASRQSHLTPRLQSTSQAPIPDRSQFGEAALDIETNMPGYSEALSPVTHPDHLEYELSPDTELKVLANGTPSSDIAIDVVANADVLQSISPNEGITTGTEDGQIHRAGSIESQTALGTEAFTEGNDRPLITPLDNLTHLYRTQSHSDSLAALGQVSVNTGNRDNNEQDLEQVFGIRERRVSASSESVGNATRVQIALSQHAARLSGQDNIQRSADTLATDSGTSVGNSNESMADSESDMSRSNLTRVASEGSDTDSGLGVLPITESNRTSNTQSPDVAVTDARPHVTQSASNWDVQSLSNIHHSTV